MPFEFDPVKSAANKAKHGIDFEEARALWDDLGALTAPTRIGLEPRYIVIGMIGTKRWVAVCTLCGENVRIISVRSARKEEIGRYEGA